MGMRQRVGRALVPSRGCKRSSEPVRALRISHPRAKWERPDEETGVMWQRADVTALVASLMRFLGGTNTPQTVQRTHSMVEESVSGRLLNVTCKPQSPNWLRPKPERFGSRIRPLIFSAVTGPGTGPCRRQGRCRRNLLPLQCCPRLGQRRVRTPQVVSHRLPRPLTVVRLNARCRRQRSS